MSGRLWCDDRGMEGWVVFSLPVTPSSNNRELDALIRAVNGSTAVSPGSFWVGRDAATEVRELAQVMLKTQVAVTVHVDEEGTVSVARWHRRRA